MSVVHGARAINHGHHSHWATADALEEEFSQNDVEERPSCQLRGWTTDLRAGLVLKA
jgi:hypothetical protein